MEYQLFVHIQDYDIKQRGTVNLTFSKLKPAKIEVEKYTRAASTFKLFAVCAACLFCLHSSQL